MKRSDELKIQKKTKLERMTEITTKAKNGESVRMLTTDEQTEYDGLKEEVRQLNIAIKDAEDLEQENENSRAVNGNNGAQHQRGVDGPQVMKRASKVYDASKALREFSRNINGADNLTGLEAEQHQELSRGISTEGLLIPAPSIFDVQSRSSARAVSEANYGASNDVIIDPNLSLIGSVPIYAQMGLNVIEGLQGTFKIGKETASVGGKYADGVAVTATNTPPTFVSVSPDRYGITDLFDKEELAQLNPMVNASIMRNMMLGCDRKLTQEVYAIALAAATEVATGALTHAGFLSLMKSVKEGGAFAMSRDTFFDAMDVKIDVGSGKFLADLSTGGDNGVGVTNKGVKSFYSDLWVDGANAQYVIYGSWRHIWAGFWGALEVLRNPFTYQKNGQIELTVNRLAHIASQNDAAFVKSPDLNPA